MSPTCVIAGVVIVGDCDTFGDEAFWSDALGLDKAIEGAKHGGVGDGVSPKTAFALGLKVDMDALPADVVAAVKAGKVDMNDPATTLTLIKLNAVVGVTEHPCAGPGNQDQRDEQGEAAMGGQASKVTQHGIPL